MNRFGIALARSELYHIGVHSKIEVSTLPYMFVHTEEFLESDWLHNREFWLPEIPFIA